MGFRGDNAAWLSAIGLVSRFTMTLKVAPRRPKAIARFSRPRAERMDWIEETLQDPTATLKQGWIKAERRHDPQRRVALVKGNYVVVIAINQRNPKKANFVTAFVADTPNTLKQFLESPAWR